MRLEKSHPVGKTTVFQVVVGSAQPTSTVLLNEKGSLNLRGNVEKPKLRKHPRSLTARGPDLYGRF